MQTKQKVKIIFYSLNFLKLARHRHPLSKERPGRTDDVLTATEICTQIIWVQHSSEFLLVQQA